MEHPVTLPTTAGQEFARGRRIPPQTDRPTHVTETPLKLARPALCLALVASVAAAGAAGAATRPRPKPLKPVCNLVTDESGDATFQPPLPTPSDDALDIVSGDIATNAKTLTGVVRVKALGGTSPSQFTGQTYYLQFNVPGFANPLYVGYQFDQTAALFQYGDLETTQGQGIYTPKGNATGVVDTVKNEIRISVPITDLASLARVKPGMKLTGIQALTFQNVGVPNAAGGGGLLGGGDTADGTKAYVAGYPSCVKPGV